MIRIILKPWLAFALSTLVISSCGGKSREKSNGDAVDSDLTANSTSQSTRNNSNSKSDNDSSGQSTAKTKIDENQVDSKLCRVAHLQFKVTKEGEPWYKLEAPAKTFQGIKEANYIRNKSSSGVYIKADGSVDQRLLISKNAITTFEAVCASGSRTYKYQFDVQTSKFVVTR